MDKMPELKVKSKQIHNALVFHYSFKEPSSWVCCTVCEETGELSIQSDWGNFSYRWSHNGFSGRFLPWVANTMQRSPWYIVDKFSYGETPELKRELDPEATVTYMLEAIDDGYTENQEQLAKMIKDLDFEATVENIVETAPEELHDCFECLWEWFRTKPSYVSVLLAEKLLPFLGTELQAHLEEARK